MPSKYLYRGDLAIHYEHTGTTTLPGMPPRMEQGNLLLFVHGAGGNGRLWSRQLDYFAAEHTAIALDLPGHGRSGGLDGPGSVVEGARIVTHALGMLGGPPAILVGHGIGGQMALLAALEDPARVRAVVTLGTSVSPASVQTEIEVLEDVVRGRRPQSFDAPFFAAKPDMGLVREVWGEIVKTDPRVRLQDLRDYAASDLRASVAKLAQATLVLHGAEDRYCPDTCARELVQAIPRAQFVAIPSAGHVAHVEQPELVNSAIEEFAG